MLPGGVAEVTGLAAAAPGAAEAGVVAPGAAALVPAAGAAAAGAGAGAAEAAAPPAPPIVPVRDETDTDWGSTRPNSWKTWAQSKRESTRVATACMRCSRIAMKLA